MKVIGERAKMYTAYSTRLHRQDRDVIKAVMERRLPVELLDTLTIAQIKKFTRKKGFAPLDPFGCGDYDDYEGGPVGRQDTLKWTLYLQRGQWWSGYFGWSQGVMKEFLDRLSWDKEQRMRVFYEDDSGTPFDPLWEEEYQKWSKVFNRDPLAELRGPNKIFQVVGARAVGKTYAMKQLLEARSEILGIVRNITTRPPREAGDKDFYHLVSKEQFSEQRDYLDFVESVEYEESCYGSSLSEARKVLRSKHGIHAMTPEGAMAWHKECRFDFNLVTILLTASPAVLKKNLERRKIFDPWEQEQYIQKASRFVLPPSIPHLKLEMTGTKADKERILDLVGPILTPLP